MRNSTPSKDFGNQLLVMQRLKRTKIANCALLCPLFIICWQIPPTHAPATLQQLTEYEITRKSVHRSKCHSLMRSPKQTHTQAIARIGSAQGPLESWNGGRRN